MGTVSRVFREEEEKPFVELREEKRKTSAIAAMQMARKMIGELGPDLDFGVFLNAIGGSIVSTCVRINHGTRGYQSPSNTVPRPLL